ncbi:bacterial luciferase-like protein [Thozetella sp. PMI_491]|nr:bacterial luciferase-like protein [Thozetella sp. PMI_491]
MAATEEGVKEARESSVNPLLAEGHFLLGTFASNTDGGQSLTKIPERWVNSFENNLKLAKLLDDAGIDFMLPVARWIGFGASNCHGNVLETLTWAAGLLAQTKSLNVIATVHTAANHPVVVAKQIATIDQISNSRIGLNIVAGWNKPEYEALGLELPASHEERYAYAQEWFEIVDALWTKTEPFDHDGKFWKLKKVVGVPRPMRQAPIINAAGSGEGRAFAVRNAHFLFTPTIELEKSRKDVAELKALGKEAGRDVRVLTMAHVVCRPTEQEAKDYVDYYGKENVDWDALDSWMDLQFANAKSFPKDVLKDIRDRVAAFHGGYPLVGTPQQVADGILALHEVGYSGTTLSFVDYVKEFPYFRDNVLPILEKAGIRKAKAVE